MLAVSVPPAYFGIERRLRDRCISEVVLNQVVDWISETQRDDSHLLSIVIS